MSTAKKKKQRGKLTIKVEQRSGERMAVVADELWNAEAMLAAVGDAMNECAFADNGAWVTPAFVAVWRPLGKIANEWSEAAYGTAETELDDHPARLEEIESLLGALSNALDARQINDTGCDPCRVIDLAMKIVASARKEMLQILPTLEDVAEPATALN
jgi:hypothetical protein